MLSASRALCLAVFFVAVSSLPVSDTDNEIPINEEQEISEGFDLSHLGQKIFGLPNNKTDIRSLVVAQVDYMKQWRIIELFEKKSTESGERVSNWTDSSLENPEELGEYVEGDILFPVSDSRNGLIENSSRWPNGIVPYVIEGYYTSQQRETIMRAIADYHRLSCIRFVPYKGQTDYVAIQSRSTGCWSSVGRVGGRQEVNLQNPGCVSKKGTVLHELLHALGFLHEQSRPERDDYVSIKYQNVKYGSENNFQKASKQSTNGFGIPYDYNSVMHYSEYAFSRNGEKTIVSRVSGVTLGQREGLSRGDVKKLNAMYNCSKK